MTSLYTGIGRLVSVRTPNFNTTSEVLEIKMSVNTGEKKKEEDTYAPSILVKAFLWGNYAKAMKDVLAPGQIIFLHGELGTPETYVTEGGDTVITHFVHNVTKVRKLVDGGEGSSSTEKESVPKETTKTKKSSTRAKVLEDDDAEDDVEALF